MNLIDLQITQSKVNNTQLDFLLMNWMLAVTSIRRKTLFNQSMIKCESKIRCLNFKRYVHRVNNYLDEHLRNTYIDTDLLSFYWHLYVE